MGTTTWVLVIVIAVAFYYHCNCEMDAVVGCVNEGDSGCYFSDTYWEARSKFRSATIAAGWELETIPISKGSEYTIDFAYKPAKGTVKQTVVHLSGTHGVEGYAGSAIQLKYLKEGTASEDTSIVLVHVMNPYGMAHNRRWNENNVDLNRNGIYDPKEFEALKSRDPNIAGYFDQDDLINPKYAPSLSDTFTVFFKAGFSIARHGFGALKKALVAAQYIKPEGIFYGGSEIQPSYVILKKYLESKKLHETTSRVTVIDVHTGLGPKGADTLLVDDSDAFKLVTRRFKIMKEETLSKVESLDGSSEESQAADGYDLTKGVNSHAMRHIFSKSTEFLGICHEFGTLPGVLVARALILENMAYHHDPSHQPYWAQYTRDAFYCRDEAWREVVLRRGVRLLEQATQ
eukprot:TRINITY_DN17735_c0_g1_i1.p1 TRINITY_DN17735_c0_g1~~TRINITY_DN17735_c0_g1_i1.p1  ORF type:complete len:402 (+),score=58.69 TRINITY_DN17735_c0_g1_i1:51-1256(+)